MLLTIVTVCLNEEKRIRKTVESVLKQKENDFEYVVLDGKSKDNTIKVLESYRDKFDRRGISYRVISQSDTGIYNAMNNALEYAKGKWILFLNAGDGLYAKNLVEIIRQKDICDVIYGDVLLIENGYYKKKKADDYHRLLTEMPMCHQSVLCRTDLVKTYRFQEEYHLAADYDLLLRLLRDGKHFEYIHRVISVFLLDGASMDQAWGYQTEMMRCGRRVCGMHPGNQCRALLNSLIRIGKKWGARLFPTQYHSTKRGWIKI